MGHNTTLWVVTRKGDTIGRKVLGRGSRPYHGFTRTTIGVFTTGRGTTTILFRLAKGC